MLFPNGSMKIAKPRFKAKDRVVYTSKDGEEYTGTVVDCVHQGIVSGYVCSIVLDEPCNGTKNYRVKEEKLAKYKHQKKQDNE